MKSGEIKYIEKFKNNDDKFEILPNSLKVEGNLVTIVSDWRD